MTKKLTVLIYGADRKAWAGPKAQLRITDFNDASRSKPKILINRPVSGAIIEVNLDLRFDAGQVYPLVIEAKGHQAAWQLISHQTFIRGQSGNEVESAEAILRLMLMPNKPESSDLPGGYGRIVDQGSQLAHVWQLDERGYGVLEAPQQMALLNITAKLLETYLNSVPVMSFVMGLRAIDPDRLFLLVKAELKGLVDRSKDFAPAGGHGVPGEHPGLPAHPDSWKHQLFGAGNVQLSFSENAEPWPTNSATARNCYSVDVDIDLARGPAHILEWLHNQVFDPGDKTDQTKVYALLYGQGILPLYTFDESGPRKPRRSRNAK